MAKLRDRDRTQDAILQAATALFLAQGPAAVPLSAVAKKAGVTKSLIHHYFGDKHGLWRATKAAALAPYESTQRQIFQSGSALSGTEALTQSLGAYFSALQKFPDMARALALEALEGAPQASAVEARLQDEGRTFIADLQTRGQLREDVAPALVLALFSAATEHWFVHRDRLAALNGTDPDTLEAAYFDAAVKVLSDGLRPQTSEDAGGSTP